MYQSAQSTVPAVEDTTLSREEFVELLALKAKIAVYKSGGSPVLDEHEVCKVLDIYRDAPLDGLVEILAMRAKLNGDRRTLRRLKGERTYLIALRDRAAKQGAAATATAPLVRVPRPRPRRAAARRAGGERSSADPGDGGERHRPPHRRGELRPLSHALAAVLEDLQPRELHLADLWWGSPRRLIDILDWSAFPLQRVAEGWLTHCPVCVRGPLLVTEPHADHAAFTCGHGCPEAAIRVKLREVEALASESIDEGVAR